MSFSYDYKRYQVLFVDDEEQALEYFAEVFADDFNILTAANAEAAWQVLQEQGDHIAVLISDQRMPGQQGSDLLGRVRLQFPHVVRILTTAYSDLASAVAAVNMGGVFRYLTKPWELDEVRGTLLRAMEFALVRLDRDRLLGERLHVLQRLIVMDRVRGLAASAAAIRCRLGNTMSAFRAYVRQASLEQRRHSILDGAPQMDLATLARTESASLIRVVQKILRATVPRDLDRSDCRLEDEVGDVSLPDAMREVAERLRIDAGSQAVRLQVDDAPAWPKVVGNRELLCRLFEILVDRLRTLSGASAPITLHLSLESQANAEMLPRVSVRTEGPAWQPESLAAFFAAVVPRTSWTEMEADLLAAFFLAHHHGATLRLHPAPPLGPGFELVFLPPAAIAAEEELDANWFDEVFAGLEQS